MSNIEKSNKELMGEAILLHERTAHYLHTQQRSQDLRRASPPERIASLMKIMNQELSQPDEHRESVIASHTRDLLRNNNVKSQLAIHMSLQAQIHRLSNIIAMQEKVDNRFMDMIDDLDPDQLIAAQRSIHKQGSEIVDYLRTVGSENIEAIVSSLNPQKGEEAQATLAAIEKLRPEERERITEFLKKMYYKTMAKSGVGPDPVASTPSERAREKVLEYTKKRKRKPISDGVSKSFDDNDDDEQENEETAEN